MPVDPTVGLGKVRMSKATAAAQPRGFRVRMRNPHTREALEDMVPDLRERFENSHFSDSYARSLGLRGATLNGGLIKTQIAAAVTNAWGSAWWERGALHVRYRQPLFDGDEVEVSFSPLTHEDDAATAEYRVENAQGVVCVLGSVTLRGSANALPVESTFRSTPPLAKPLDVTRGRSLVGARLPSEVIEVADDLAARIRAGDLSPAVSPGLAGEICAAYAALDVSSRELRDRAAIPPWTIPGGVVGLDFSAARFPSATEVREEYFRVASLDDRLTMHSRVTDAFERKGSKYIETEHLVVGGEGASIAWRRLTAMVEKAPPVPAQRPVT